MDNKKSKRGRTKSLGGHVSATARKKARNVDDCEKEMRDRMEAANVLSSLRFLAPQSQEPSSSVSAVKASDKVPKFPVTYKMSDKNHGNPTSLSAAPSANVGKPAIKYMPAARGSGKGHGSASQGVVLSEQANKFILMHLYNSLQNRQGKTETQTSTTNVPSVPSNLPSESIIPKSEAARKGTSANFKYTSSLPNVLHPTNPVNKTVAAALRNAIPAAAREKSQTVQKQSDSKYQAANLNIKSLVSRWQSETVKASVLSNLKDDKDSDSQNSKKTENTEKGLPLKKRRIFPQPGERSDLTISSVGDLSASQIDFNSQTDVKNLLRLAQTTQMTSMISGTPSHKPYTGDGFKPIDPSASLRVLSDVKQALTPDEDGDLPLHIAVVHQNNELVKRFVDIMTMSGKSVDRYNKLMQTPLHLAVLVQETDIIISLLTARSDPNLVDRNGCTAMHLAVEKGFQECLETILEYSYYNCDLSTRNFEGYTPLHTTVEKYNIGMMVCLVKNGAYIDAQDGKAGRSVLYYAVEYNRVNMVRYLHDQGANVDLPNYAGITPCMAAQPANLQRMLDIIGKGLEASKLVDDSLLSNPARKLPLPRIPSKASLIVPEVPAFGLSRSNSMEDVKPFRSRRSSFSDPVDLSLSDAAKADKAAIMGLSPLLKPGVNPTSKYKPARLVEKHAVLVEQLQSRRSSDLEHYVNIPKEKYKALLAMSQERIKALMAMKAAAEAEKERTASLDSEESKHEPVLKYKPEKTGLPDTSVKIPVKTKFDKSVLNADEYTLLQKIKSAKKDGHGAMLGQILDSDLSMKMSKFGEIPSNDDDVEEAKSIRKESPSFVDFHATESEKRFQRKEKMSQSNKSDSSNSSLKKMEVDKPDSPNANVEDADMPVLSRQVSVSSDQSRNFSSGLSENKEDETAEDSSGFRLSQGFETKDIDSETIKEKDLDEIPNITSHSEIDREDSIQHEKMDLETSINPVEDRKAKEDADKDDTSSVEVQEDILPMDEDEDHALVIDERINDDKFSNSESIKNPSKSEESPDFAETNKVGHSLENRIINEVQNSLTENKSEQNSCVKVISQKECDELGSKTENFANSSDESTDSADIDEPDPFDTQIDSESSSIGEKTEHQSLSHNSGCNSDDQGLEKSEKTLKETKITVYQVSGRETSIGENDQSYGKYNEEMMCKVHEETDWETESLATSTPPSLSKFGQIVTIDGQADKSTNRDITTPPILSKFSEIEAQSSEYTDSNVSGLSGVISGKEEMTKSRDGIDRNSDFVSSLKSDHYNSNINNKCESSVDSVKNNTLVNNLHQFEDKEKEGLIAKPLQSEAVNEKGTTEISEKEKEKLMKSEKVGKYIVMREKADAENSPAGEISRTNESTENEENTKGLVDVKVSKAHTLYFFDGLNYRSVKVYVDDTEASSDQFKRMFPEKLSKGSDRASVVLSSRSSTPLMSSKVPKVSQTPCETVTSKDENSPNQGSVRDESSNDNAKKTNKTVFKTTNISKGASIDLDSRVPKNEPFSIVRSGSETNLLASGSKNAELNLSRFQKKSGSKSSVNSNNEGMLQTDSVKLLNSSSVVYANSSDMNLTSVVDNIAPPSGPSDIGQDLTKKTSKILSKPIISQTLVKPSTSKLIIIPRTLSLSAGKTAVSTSEGTLTRINPDIKSKLSKALQSPSRKLNIVKTDSSERLFPAADLGEVSVSKEPSLRLQL